ncbi:Cu-oxidase-domain-containing protein [Sistotremastrum niveocremeum HHB9708]|uniref:laccase n=1 Tax=Sistotremastrum niveocremeum HHB9708 TaxID=1314777 RepID=A0A164RFE1_9AGAM|nr:Cu-oxidase-domain-containing protein [Sistotremastrum niveocremeum HHB9708]
MLFGTVFSFVTWVFSEKPESPQIPVPSLAVASISSQTTQTSEQLVPQRKIVNETLILTTGIFSRISPDGFERPVVLINGTFPGPNLIANTADNFSINVVNQMTDQRLELDTSIHWHGILQHRTAGSDGSEPLKSHNALSTPSIHSSIVSVLKAKQGNPFNHWFHHPKQVYSTFWYHSHVGTQYCDGLQGGLIIRDPNDPYSKEDWLGKPGYYDVDDGEWLLAVSLVLLQTSLGQDSTIVTLRDWNHLPSWEAFDDLSGEPEPNSTLVNGRGRYVGADPDEVPLAVIGPVNSGKSYRLRIINMSCNSWFRVSLDNHTFTIIEADGVALSINNANREVDSFTIFPGQRYSAVVKADQLPGNYWFRTNPFPDIYGWSPEEQMEDPGLNNAIFRYESAPIEEPKAGQIPTLCPMDESKIKPLVPPAQSECDKADQEFFLPIVAINDQTEEDRQNRSIPHYQLGNGSWIPPSLPVLLSVIRGEALPGNTYPIEFGKTIDVTFLNTEDDSSIEGAHPLHLHGVGTNLSSVADECLQSTSMSSLCSNLEVIKPIVGTHLGTIAVYDGNVTVRFRTDNPGPWIFHCHIDWHLDQGMAAVFAESRYEMLYGNNSIVFPPGWESLCPIYEGDKPPLLPGI